MRIMAPTTKITAMRGDSGAENEDKFGRTTTKYTMRQCRKAMLY